MKSDKFRGRFKKAFTKEKIVRFWDKQGFYIVLFLCIAIIGVTAFMTSDRKPDPQEIADKDMAIEESELSKTNQEDLLRQLQEDKIHIKIRDSLSEPDKKDEEVKDQNKAEDDNDKGEKDQEDEAKETLAANSTKKEEETKEKDSTKKQEKSGKSNKAQATMIYPVDGNIQKDHTVDELVYSNTLKEWTTHPGIDIGALVGTEVKAAMGGTVEEIIEDPLMGICITLDHGNGLKTYYANLSTGNMVSQGQKVDKGQIISGVGSTASAEILDAPHLHFEVELNGQKVDPKDYIK